MREPSRLISNVENIERAHRRLRRAQRNTGALIALRSFAIGVVVGIAISAVVR